ncbi:MAG: FMN-binding protein [Candidatus Izemoplasmatales bacterium]
MKKRLLIVFGVFLALFLIFGISIYMQIKQNTNHILSQSIEEVDFSEYEDGIYQGEYYSKDIGVLVLVEIENGKVISIAYDNHLNGKGEEAETINQEILDKQSIMVDDVSGATTSSRCIKLAIMNAFKEGNNNE